MVGDYYDVRGKAILNVFLIDINRSRIAIL
jgi:hypothetical protein